MSAREIRGAIHVHSSYSDGSGAVEEIIAAAQAAQLDFVILTDHDNRLAARDGYAGRHGRVLLVVGAEISPAGGGHCLALGDLDVRGYRWMPEKHYLHKLRRDGADIYVAHPEGRVKATFGINLRQWHVWESEHFDGLEIWSYMHDWIEDVTPFSLPRRYLRPERAITGPDRKVLALWDRLNMRRRVVGLGALDAHAVRKAGGLFVAFPYKFLFRTVLTHALVDDWNGTAQEDTARLRASLRAGRAYAAYHVPAAADGFRFQTARGHVMGDRATLDGSDEIAVELPREAAVTLFHNGRRTAAAQGRRVAFTIDEPGLYRVEAHLEGRPWIFPNPIFLG